MKVLDQNKLAIDRLCAGHHVKRLYAFGSVLTGRFSRESDIDLIVEFEALDPLDYADNYFDLKFRLEELLNRKIDLLEEQAIRNPVFRKSVNQKKVLLYARRDPHMVN